MISKGEELHFYFTENNSTPIEFKNQKTTSKPHAKRWKKV